MPPKVVKKKATSMRLGEYALRVLGVVTEQRLRSNAYVIEHALLAYATPHERAIADSLVGEAAIEDYAKSIIQNMPGGVKLSDIVKHLEGKQDD